MPRLQVLRKQKQGLPLPVFYKKRYLIDTTNFCITEKFIKAGGR
nr:MAG TPA: hypothetical protein [Caudoviricetes sp.]